MSTPGDQKSHPRLAGWIAFFIAALTAAVFSRTLHNGFINYDDNEYVYQNPVVLAGLTPHGIAWAFTHIVNDNWHPLTILSHMADCQLFGLRAWGHHLTNVVLHAFAAAVLFLMLREATGAMWRSAAVAMIFALHPLRVESVAWIAERKDALSGLLFMLTLWVYVRWARRRDLEGYMIIAVLLTAGLLAKPMLVTAPCVMMLMDYWPLGRLCSVRDLGARLREKWVFFLLAAVVCGATMFAQKYARLEGAQVSLPMRLGNAIVACWSYVWKTVWPVKLAIYYPILKGGWPAATIGGALVLLIAITFAAWSFRRREPAILTGWLWFLGMLVPVIGLVQVGGQAYADRYTYLPGIGLAIGAVWAAEHCTRGHVVLRNCGFALFACALVIFASLTWRQIGFWRDSETLWRHDLACARESAVAYNSLGNALNDPAAAQQDYRKAIQVDPDDVLARYNLGNSLQAQGDNLDARVQYEQALQINPDYNRARVNLVADLIRMRLPDEALSAAQEAVQREPDSAPAYSALAAAWGAADNLTESQAAWEKALKLSPDDPWTEAHLALLLAAMHRTPAEVDRALRLAQQATAATGGNDPHALRALAASYAAEGRFADASDAAQRALNRSEGDLPLTVALKAELARYQGRAAQ